jgi:small subunit ribosomal protein S6e
MPFKVNIACKGRTLKKETENEELVGKLIGESINGDEISSDLAGYELKITGTSDKSGFPGKKDVDGAELKRVLLTKGFGFKTKPKGLSKTPKAFTDGLRMKRTVRGNAISASTMQINVIVKKEGSKSFDELCPKKEAKTEAKPAESATPTTEAK